DDGGRVTRCGPHARGRPHGIATLVEPARASVAFHFLLVRLRLADRARPPASVVGHASYPGKSACGAAAISRRVFQGDTFRAAQHARARIMALEESVLPGVSQRGVCSVEGDVALEFGDEGRVVLQRS